MFHLRYIQTFISRGMLVVAPILSLASTSSTTRYCVDISKSTPSIAVSDTIKPQRIGADWPRSHEKAMMTMLKSYQRDLLALIPTVRKSPNSNKVRDFVRVYFDSDTTGIANHITPENVKPEKSIEPLASKITLKPNEFLRLLAGLYKSDLVYELDREEIEITPLDSTKLELRQVHMYQIQIPVRVAGKPNSQLQAEVKDTLDVYALVYTDGKQNVRYTRLLNIQHEGGRYVPPTPKPDPKPVTPVEPNKPDTPMIILAPAQKVFVVSQIANRLAQDVTDAEFEQMKMDFDILFFPSGFVSLTTKDGKKLRLERRAFLIRAKSQRATYELQESDIVFYDQFRDNTRGKPFCRVTTYHNVKEYDVKQLPVSDKITKATMVPVISKPDKAPATYWQLSSVTLLEK